ncbi:DNA repair protein RadA [Acidobacteria bacterium Mor1]|nr:DNA repair protein RadA [Acidobacteria bacterium Mor1]
MAKPKSAFVCEECDHVSPKWLGRCPECGSWASLSEVRQDASASGGRPRPLPVTPFPEIPEADARRIVTGIDELDRVLGGGLVPGMVVLVGGEPGVGKSTLLLQAAEQLASRGDRVLYVSGEESPAQLRLRGRRLGVDSREIGVLAETEIERIVDTARDWSPRVMIVDSIQAVQSSSVSSVPGSVGQVREAASRLVSYAKGTGTAVVLVGHVTKEGSLAGPRILEHAVDTVAQFEGDRHHAHRILRAIKNRFGATDEIGVFSMGERGLSGVANPSELFLAERQEQVPGSAVLAAIEGSRPLLIEVQALVGEPIQGSPRRTSLGVDGGRVALILAVLQRRAGLDLGSRDVFVNLTGGMSVAEPAADLAVAVAVGSSLAGLPVVEGRIACGEVGLTGEIRSVGRIESRLREAARLGFRSAVVPASCGGFDAVDGLEVYRAADVPEALRHMLGSAPRT